MTDENHEENQWHTLLLLLQLLLKKDIQVVASCSDGGEEFSSLVTYSSLSLCIQFLNVFLKSSDFILRGGHFTEEMKVFVT